MKILFVLNNFYMKGNGLAVSARHTVAALREAGQDVRVLSGPNPDPSGPQPEYLLKHFYFPLVEPIIRANGYQFASTNPKIVEEAVRWADVVHMQEPFVLEIRAAKIARKLGKPITGTYHLHPENIFYSLGMGRWRGINQCMLRIWRDLAFNKWSYVQCPTQNVLERLQNNGFTSHLCLISNGVVPDASIRVGQQNHPYILACIGRIVGEKDQQTLLKAIALSRHSHEVQLVFAGKGPQERKIRRMAKKLYKSGILAYDPIFAFMDRNGLRELAAKANLCIHCATIEVEGLSIMEAMQQGCIPIIATGPLTGADQFALDERSLFAQRDPRSLAEKIDWWLEHPEERREVHPKYIASMKSYEITHSVQALIKMFETAVNEKDI